MFITSPLSWGHTSSPGLESRHSVGVLDKGTFGALKRLLSRSLWHGRAGRTEGHGWVPSARRRWPAASLQGHRGSADTLNKAPDLGRDGSTLPTHDAQACELAGFLS